jgi:hypothetical protein
MNPMTETLDQQIARLQRSSGLVYDVMLAGLFARYGQEVVTRAMANSYSGNVVSIFSSPRWGARRLPSPPKPPRPAA